MEVIASGVQDPTFGILCRAKLKRKPIIKYLRTISTTGLVGNANATCALFYMHKLC